MQANSLRHRPTHLFAAAVLALGCLSGCDNTEPVKKANGPATTLPVSSDPIQPGKPIDWFTRIQVDGLNVHLWPNQDAQILVIEVNPELFEAQLVADVGRGGAARKTLIEQNLDLVIGSGFVADVNSMEPVGLLQHNGRMLSPVQAHGYTRILGINDEGMGVVHRSEFQRDLFHSALQAGPGIIEQGVLDISKRDLQRPKYFRSVVGVCEQRWLAAVSLAPSHLRTLGEMLVDFVTQQNWQCTDVVNLAGDRQAVLVVKDQDGHLLNHGDPSTHKTTLLGFKRREASN